MKCIAIDNDAKALEQICAYIEKTPSLQLVAKFDDADNARAYLTSDKNQVDVVFVDTDTNNIGGIDLVKSLIEPPFVVFVSNTTDGGRLQSRHQACRKGIRTTPQRDVATDALIYV